VELEIWWQVVRRRWWVGGTPGESQRPSAHIYRRPYLPRGASDALDPSSPSDNSETRGGIVCFRCDRGECIALVCRVDIVGWEIASLLLRNTKELDAIVTALDGEYVVPKPGGDLLRDGSSALSDREEYTRSLPTGCPPPEPGPAGKRGRRNNPPAPRRQYIAVVKCGPTASGDGVDAVVLRWAGAIDVLFRPSSLAYVIIVVVGTGDQGVGERETVAAVQRFLDRIPVSIEQIERLRYDRCGTEGRATATATVPTSVEYCWAVHLVHKM